MARRTTYLKGQLLPVVRVVFGIIFAVFSTCCSGLAANRQARSALDVQPLEPAEYHMLSHKKLLFATSREVVRDADKAARSKPGGSVSYEKVFRGILSPLIAYGWVEVGYPSDRQFGAQNYNPDPSNPNPFSYFSIESFGVVGTREAARQLAAKEGFNLDERALVFVHGIETTFTDAAERLTQMVVDLNVKGTPLLFSWPSETEVPIIGVSPDSYRHVLTNARTSEAYFAQAVDDILYSNSEPFDLLAHSMGTLVAFDVLQSMPLSGVSKLDPNAPPSPMLPNIVLAAPDIGMKHFVAGHQEFMKRTRRVTVYCGNDIALFFSKQVNGDDRLGYCGSAKRQPDFIEGVEFVRIFGSFHDPFRHSYYINSPTVVHDIQNSLSGSFRSPYREIRLDN